MEVGELDSVDCFGKLVEVVHHGLAVSRVGAVDVLAGNVG